MGAAVLAWVVVAAALLERAAERVRAGEAAVRVAQARITASSISAPQSPDLLAPVVADFGAAHADLASPLVSPLDVLPVIGRQLRTVRTLASAAHRVGDIGDRAIAQARAALRAPHTTGPERVAAADALAEAATTADRGLAGVSLGRDHALVGFVRTRYDEFAGRLAKVQAGVHRGAEAARATAVLLRGPTHLLLLGANNAEMRNGSGMFLSAAELDIVNGTITVGSVQATSDLVLQTDAVAPIGSYGTVWSAFLANADFRNLGVSPRFDTTAALAARMWQARTGQAVDGVMSVDIDALHALLGVAGPVSAGGRRVGAADVVQFLMHDQYVGLAGTDVDAAARHEQLGEIARAALDTFQHGGFASGALAAALPAMVAGRHLMMWSSQPALERAWQAAGVAGTVRADTLLLAVQNMGVNKLDRFLSVSTDVSIAPSGTGTAVRVTAHLVNSVGAGQPAYIAGKGAGGEPPYTYRAYVTLSMPVSASALRVDGADTAAASGADGPIRTVAVLRDVAPGQLIDVVFTFRLTGVHGHLQVESAARVPAATVRVIGVAGAPISDEHRPRIEW